MHNRMAFHSVLWYVELPSFTDWLHPEPMPRALNYCRSPGPATYLQPRDENH
jgi:hypothetical protein